jgi:RHS repeat-associated protein
MTNINLLNDEYQSLCEKVILKLSRKKQVPFLTGKVEIWASAVVWCIARVNFLFDKANKYYLTSDDICNYFGTKKSTVGQKATLTDYQYDGFGRLSKAGDAVYDYDRNGNLNGYKAPGESLRLKYDGVGQLINVQSARQKIQYKYDGLGNLISSKKKGETSHYLPDLSAPPGRILAEYNDRKNVFYTYGETLLACRDKGENKYFLEDGFNSIRQVVNQRGEVTGEADYLPFGEVISKEGEIPEFRTAGERYLSEAGLYLIGSRPYDPQSGRYLTPDPVPPELSQFDTFNRYAHGCRNPGIYMAPRCNQTRQKVIFVGGINVPLSELKRLGSKRGIEIISTSSCERTVLPLFLEHLWDTLLRAPLNYLGLPGGKGQALNQLLEYQKAYPGDELSIRAHSNGAITIVGRILTTPQRELAKEVGYPLPIPGLLKGLFIKGGALWVWGTEPFRPGEIIGLGYHDIERNYPQLLPQEEQSASSEEWPSITLPRGRNQDEFVDIERKIPSFPS